MAEEEPVIEDKFGPPHAQTVSQNLQFWILVPGIIALVVFIGKLPRYLLGEIVEEHDDWELV